MYYLIDQLTTPSKFEAVFLKHISEFKQFYLSVKGVKKVEYLKTTLEAFANQATIRNPNNSYLLIIIFDCQKNFKAYHDNSSLAQKIHQQISKHFNNQQLPIKTSLHGRSIKS